MNHDILMILSATLPMKRIMVNDELYLERYHVKNDQDGTQHWLHRFLRNDSERHMHSHPWHAVSKVIYGSYTEDVRRVDGSILERSYKVGDTNYIPEDKIHRIITVAPNTWTYMIVRPERLDQWFFIDEKGNKHCMQTSPADWYLSCKTRLAQNSTD